MLASVLFLHVPIYLLNHKPIFGMLQAELAATRKQVSDLSDERAELDKCVAQYAATVTRLQENDSRRAVEATTRVAVLQASKDKAWQDHERMLGSYSELTARFVDLKAKLTQAALDDTAKSKKLADAARDKATAERARDDAVSEAAAAAAREREARREAGEAREAAAAAAASADVDRAARAAAEAAQAQAQAAAGLAVAKAAKLEEDLAAQELQRKELQRGMSAHQSENRKAFGALQEAASRAQRLETELAAARRMAAEAEASRAEAEADAGKARGEAAEARAAAETARAQASRGDVEPEQLAALRKENADLTSMCEELLSKLEGQVQPGLAQVLE